MPSSQPTRFLVLLAIFAVVLHGIPPQVEAQDNPSSRDASAESAPSPSQEEAAEPEPDAGEEGVDSSDEGPMLATTGEATGTADEEPVESLAETVVESALAPEPVSAPAPAPAPRPVAAVPEIVEPEIEEPLIIDDSMASVATGLPLEIRETPQSISVIDRERFEQEGFFDAADVLRDSAGVHVTNLDSERTAYYSRGFAIQELKIDGVRSGTATRYASMPEDTAIYERIEVIRGSDGLLTGAGNPSATVNMVRKRPGHELGGYITGSVGTWEFGRLEGDVSAPLTEDGRVRGRFVGVRQDTESFKDRYSEEKQVLYGIVEADLTDTTTLAAGYSFQRTAPRASSWGTVPYFAADGTPADLPRSTNWATDYSRIEQDAGTYFVQLEQEIGDWTLKTDYAHRDITKDWKVAYAGGGVPDLETGEGMFFWRSYGPRNWGSGTEDLDNFQLSASGPVELWGREHDVAAGFNYYHSKLHAPGSTAIYSWDTVVPDFRTYDFNQPEPTLVYDGTWQDVVTQDYGGYASARLNPTDEFHVILGGRVSFYETYQENYDASGNLFLVDQDLYEDSVFTPYAGLVHDFTDRLSGYASFTDIFDPQRVFDFNRELFDPVRGRTVEAGLKRESDDRRWLGTASLFQTWKSDSFVTDYSVEPFPDGSFPAVSTGPITSQGFEFEFTGRVTDDWSLHASYTHVRTVDDFGLPTQSNLPEDMVKLSTHYRFPGKLNKLSVGGGMRWQSEVDNAYWGSSLGVIEQGAYAVFDLNAQYEISENLTASMVMRNLFDKTYFSNVGFYDGVYFGEPFNVQLSLRYDF